VLRRLIPLLVLVSACGGPAVDTTDVPELAPFDAATFAAELEESSRPVVVNVWASWCAPCRSEAPLLTAAAEQFGDRVDFVGIDINDEQGPARAFIAEFHIPYRNLFDPNAEVRGLFGGTGVPLTYFVAPGGEIVQTHFGVIDEQALALGIDDLLRR
jgi:cytochrome c biogenesis protein CcmG/thiol:disulfide interchange protein DsbE